MTIIQNISNYGDILAIPFFLLLVIYFHEKENKTIFEYILYLFSISGLLLDSYFTYLFYSVSPLPEFVEKLKARRDRGAV
jgi:hypothetical protein